jgi:alkylhydroperoxidase/carboxymuconolactone decarboxylase family protein YurZ
MPAEDNKRILHKAMVTRVLEGDGKASQAQRRAAFDNSRLSEPLSTLVNKVATYAYKVTDEDIVATRASGLSEDEIFEIIICAAIGQATRQYETALLALDVAAMKE